MPRVCRPVQAPDRPVSSLLKGPLPRSRGETGRAVDPAGVLRVRHWVRAISAYVDGLVHPRIRPNALAAARHRAFIAAHLAMGAVTLAGFPLYLALRGGLGPAEASAFGLLALSPALALLLSRTGRLALAQLGSAAVLCLVVVIVAYHTGGMTSFALVWALLIPAEAALSGSRRVVAQSTGLTVASIVLVCAADVIGLVPPGSGLAASPVFHAAGVLVAVLYAGRLALLNQELERLGAAMTRSGEARYAMLAENLNDLVAKFGARGAVLYASPTAASVLDTPPEDLIGQGLFDRVHVQDRPAYLQVLAAAQSGDAPVAAEIRLCSGPRSTPHFVWAEMRCRPLLELGQVVAVIRDISERKLHEIEIEAARAEAERANAAKGAFIATMSHELRTPLNAVIGFSEMLMNRETLQLDPTRESDYAALIHSSGQHLLGVVNGILDMSRLETGKFGLVTDGFQIAEVLSACRQMMQLKAESAGVTMAVQVDPGLPEIVGDQRACRQVVLNLLSNALKFTPAQGRVVLSAKSARGGLAVAVEDSGVGIASRDLPRLGEAFFQAHTSYDRPYEGTGLGLSIVKGLAALHGGYVEIASQVGRGTTVTVYLPLDAESETARSALAKPSTIQSLRAFDPDAEARQDSAWGCVEREQSHRWKEKRRA